VQVTTKDILPQKRSFCDENSMRQPSFLEFYRWE
jgi:hypothetical protein